MHRAPITEQGGRLARWTAIEAVQPHAAMAGWLVATPVELTARHGRNIAVVAVAAWADE